MLKKLFFLVVPFGLLSGVAAADDSIFAELENFDAAAIVELDMEDVDVNFDELSEEAFDINDIATQGDDIAEELCGYFGYGYGYGYGYGCGYRNFGCYNYCYNPCYYSCYTPCYSYYRVCAPIYRSYWCW
ncbi:hypothetical protein [Calycomorphotria hydatis]|uniref:Uncharacterized protein n=1 Tax=Calycomorphotria hydatis TaxID=2528027 RepID=A0A517TEG0_9PLAN|nr:hypothetical protein [Calycomorphotria hydatis]QDT66757.1 hypothetical protein V22_40280 [Calycomorphotria hydatis]